MKKPSAIDRRPQRVWFAVTLLFASYILCGCLQVRSYVDPKLPRASLADIQPPQSPGQARPLQLTFEFQRNGSPHGGVTRQVRPQIVRVLTDSKLFSSVSARNSNEEARLEIVLNNLANIGDAAGKGFLTGLTFGGAGSLVTDSYVMSATFAAPGKPRVSKTYEHALHTTIGNKKGPEGLQPKSVKEAFEEVVDQLMLNLLRDLQKEGAL